jgi:hypothetical protein
MPKHLKFAMILIATMCSAAWPPLALAETIPTLMQTELFTGKAKDCSVVDLSTWQGPAKDVWARGHVTLEKMQSCNGGTYPIYYVRYDKDPTTFAHPNFFNDEGYLDLLESNSRNSYAIVDLKSSIITYVTSESKTTVRFGYDYERYKN